MGAVFVLFSAKYFWIPKILGLEYNRKLGKVHFWILFIGVNATFFPLHFLSLQGMPRIISDYPDAFAGWNLISSFGSIISIIATWLFLYIVYIQLVEGKPTSRYLWLTPQFYSDSLQTFLNRSYNSLEWALDSPPKPHAFVSLPLQSLLGLIIYNFLSNTKVIIYRFITMFILANLFKSSLSIYFGIPYTPFEYIFTTYMSIVGALLWDIYIILPSPFALFDYFVHGKNIFTDVELPRYLKMNMAPGGGDKFPLFNSQDSTSKGGGSKDNTNISKIHQKVIDSIYTDEIKKEYSKFIHEMNKIAKSLKDRQEMLDKGTITMDNPEVVKILLMMLQDQSQFFDGSILHRIELIKVTLPSLPSHIKTDLSLIEKQIHEIHDNKTKFIDKVRNIKDEKQQIKVFFDDFNAYRNKVRKEIIKYETISHNGFKNNLSDLYKLKEFKQLVNVEAPKSIKEVVDQDSYLKTKISEIINARKK